MSADRHSLQEIVGLLSPSLGDAKAREAILGAMNALGMSEGLLDRAEALRVLDHIAGTQGLVGIAARCAKTRIHLKW